MKEEVDISDVWTCPAQSTLKAIDLFCGCGGLSKGLELAGINVIAGVDYFKEAGDTYRANFKHTFIYGDITQDNTKQQLFTVVRGGNTDTIAGKIDIIAGGFPCQGFSMAGKRDPADPRNKLYKEVISIVNRLRPGFIFLENVAGLITMNDGKVLEEIQRDFRQIGYKIQAHILNAADFETPQKRERVIFMGNRYGCPILYPKPIVKDGRYRTTRDAIEDLMNRAYDAEFSHIATKHSKEMQTRLLNVEEGCGLYDSYHSAWRKCPWDAPSCTIKENHGGVNIHPKLPRVLTVRECARLQGFPDSFLFKGAKSRQLVQVGNAVPPNLAKAAGLAIRKVFRR